MGTTSTKKGQVIRCCICGKPMIRKRFWNIYCGKRCRSVSWAILEFKKIVMGSKHLDAKEKAHMLGLPEDFAGGFTGD